MPILVTSHRVFFGFTKALGNVKKNELTLSIHPKVPEVLIYCYLPHASHMKISDRNVEKKMFSKV